MRTPLPPTVPYPMFICGQDGVVYDRRRDHWHGMPESQDRIFCPICGIAMEVEPKEPPFRIFFCYQCGTTFDRERTAWYGLMYYLVPA
jgi:hypothetical protein